MSKKTEEVIKHGQPRDMGHIDYTRHDEEYTTQKTRN